MPLPRGHLGQLVEGRPTILKKGWYSNNSGPLDSPSTCFDHRLRRVCMSLAGWLLSAAVQRQHSPLISRAHLTRKAEVEYAVIQGLETPPPPTSCKTGGRGLAAEQSPRSHRQAQLAQISAQRSPVATESLRAAPYDDQRSGLAAAGKGGGVGRRSATTGPPRP